MRTRYYTLFGEALDKEGGSHIVTVVGEYTQFKEDSTEEVDIFDDDGVKWVATRPVKKQKRVLRLAYSICHPDDNFSKEEGIKIAKRRLKEGKTIGELLTYDFTMLNPDQCEMMVLNEVGHIIKHIDTYIER